MTIEEWRQECRQLGVPIPHKASADRQQALIELVEAIHSQESRLLLLRHRLEREL